MANPIEVGKSVSFIDANSVNVWPITSTNNIFYITGGSQDGNYSGEYVSPVTGNMIAYCYDTVSTSGTKSYTRRYKIHMSTEPQGNGESESELRYDHKFDQGNEFTSTTSTWDKMTAAGKMGPVSVEDNGKRIPRVVTFIDTKEFTTDSCANFVGTGSKPVFSQKFSVLTAYMTDMNRILEDCRDKINEINDVNLLDISSRGDVFITKNSSTGGKNLKFDTYVNALSSWNGTHGKIYQEGGYIFIFNGITGSTKPRFNANESKGYNPITAAVETTTIDQRYRPLWGTKDNKSYQFAYTEDLSNIVKYIQDTSDYLYESILGQIDGAGFITGYTAVESGSNITVTKTQNTPPKYKVALNDEITVNRITANNKATVKGYIDNYWNAREYADSSIYGYWATFNNVSINKDLKIAQWENSWKFFTEANNWKYYNPTDTANNGARDYVLHWKHEDKPKLYSNAGTETTESKILHEIQTDAPIQIRAAKNILFTSEYSNAVNPIYAPIRVLWQLNDKKYWGKSPKDGTITIKGDPAETWFNGVFPIISATGGINDAAAIDLSINQSPNSTTTNPKVDLRLCTYDNGIQRIVAKQNIYYTVLDASVGSSINTALKKVIRKRYYSRNYPSDTLTFVFSKNKNGTASTISSSITKDIIKACCQGSWENGNYPAAFNNYTISGVTGNIEENTTYYLKENGTIVCVINPREGKPGGAINEAEAIILDENHNTVLPKTVFAQNAEITEHIHSNTLKTDTSITTKDLYVTNLHTNSIDFGGNGNRFLLDNGISGNTIPLKVKFKYPWSNAYVTSNTPTYTNNSYELIIDATDSTDIVSKLNQIGTKLNWNFRVSKFGICELWGELKKNGYSAWTTDASETISSTNISTNYYPKQQYINQVLWVDNSRTENNRSICITLIRNSNNLTIKNASDHAFDDLLTNNRVYFKFMWAL